MLDTGMTRMEIAEELGCSYWSVCRALPARERSREHAIRLTLPPLETRLRVRIDVLRSERDQALVERDRALAKAARAEANYHRHHARAKYLARSVALWKHRYYTVAR